MKLTINSVAIIIFILFTSAQCQDIIIEPEYQLNQLNYDESFAHVFRFGGEGVSLALSGGGARGLAQIGVLEVLQENDIPVKFVAGTSMGAVIGGLYCAGYSPQELHELATTVDWEALFSSAPIRSSILVSAKGRQEKSLFKIGIDNFQPVIPRGITSGQKLSNLLTELSYRAGVRSSISFDLLNPPFRATATDLVTGRLEVISSGDLAEAMRASMSFPVGFTPVATGDKLYVDGGLINPLPVDLCREITGGPVIAVNTTTPLFPVDEINDAIDMANQSTTVMSMPNLEDQLEKADIVLTPAIGYHKTFDFENIDSLIDAGRAAALAKLPVIKASLVKDKDSDGEKYPVTDTDIKGLVNLPNSFFNFALATNDTVSEITIKDNLQRILKSGYIRNARAELSSTSDTYRLTYLLEDNPRIKGFSFSGLTRFSPQTIMSNLHSRPGEIANYITFIEDVKTIEKLYAGSGYTLARIKFPYINPRTGIVLISVDEGIISNIKIEGNDQTKDWVILRDLHLNRDKLFTARKAQRSINDLYATGLFETVKLTAEPCSVGIDMTVKVEEKSFDFIRSGVRFDREYKSAGFLDLVASNIMGTGNEASVSGQFGERKRAYLFSVKADRIFKTYLTYKLTFGHSLFKRNLYIDHDKSGHLTETETGAEFEIGQQFPRLGKLSAVLNYSRHIYREPGATSDEDKRLVSLSIRSTVDTYDALPIPESGKYHYFDLEFAGDILGGEMIYTKFYTMAEAYYPLVLGFNFHPKGELGFFNRTPPYFKKFFLGGRNSFYGLYDHEQAGAKILGASFELRKQIDNFLYVTGRYDFGKVWNNLQSIRFDQLEHGIGCSLMAKTIIGPVGIGYGRTDLGREAWYFYAGHDY